VLFELGLDLGNCFVARAVLHDSLRLLLAQLLVWEKLDDLAAGLGSFLDGFKSREAVEGVGLCADSEAVLLIFIGNGIGPRQADGGDNGHRKEKCFRVHKLV
jgi:hypothetical protein